MMFNLSYFERLIETVTMLVRHPEYPTKRLTIEQSRQEVTELIRAGRLTVPEAEILYEILDNYAVTRAGVSCGCREQGRAAPDPVACGACPCPVCAG
jgi:hypothetical protein